MMRRGTGIVLLFVFVLLLVGPTAVRYLSYYHLSGSQDRGPIPTYEPADAVAAVVTPASASFIDEPTVGNGRVLLDMAHQNAFKLDELAYLQGRLAARGFDVVPFENSGRLAAALRTVNAFIVVTPLRNFSFEEVQAVKAFVARGGRLLLVGDPTRFDIGIEETLFEITFYIEDDQIPLNSLATAFDITYNGDYLYNLVENEGNFRNIVLNGGSLGENPLTDGLEQVAFYGAHSLEMGMSATAVLHGDDNTWSSATDRPGGLTLAAVSADGRVLALSDLHFLMEPYYTSYDNGRFIARIADFLTESNHRRFTLADFPYFYSQPVGLGYVGNPQLGPQAFDQVITLRSAFRAIGQELILTAAPATGQDTLLLGLYNQVDEHVLDILASNGITLSIEPPVLTAREQAALDEEEKESESEDEEAEEAETATAKPSRTWLIYTPLGQVQMSGTAVILLDESDGRRQVIVLAASLEGLYNTVELLLDVMPLNADYESAGCVLQENLALCPTAVSNEEVEAELLTGGQPDGPQEEEAEDEEDEKEDEEEEEPGPAIDADNQGVIELDETVSGELDEGQSHAWTFNGGPGVIDILVEGEGELDAVLELYDANNNFVASADSTFSGEPEELLSMEIDDDGDWTIVVRDYYEDGGSYSLTVTLSDDQAGGGGEIENIFLFVDDDGEPISGGFTSADAFLALLSDSYEVVTWVSSVDGPLTAALLEDMDLLIWDSGDYRNVNGFFDADTAVIFQYLDSGGALFVTGASPTILADVELATLLDLEVSGDDEILLDGLEEGQVITLDEAYEVGITDLLEAGLDENSTIFFLRGPDSEEAGDIVGLAVIDDFSGQRSVLLLLPFTVLPQDIQETLLNNIMAWLVA